MNFVLPYAKHLMMAANIWVASYVGKSLSYAHKAAVVTTLALIK